MKIFFYFCLLIIISKKNIISGKSPCFEYSCDECESEEYGKCTKCREGWKLVDGVCPCSDSSCALCETGLAGLHICILCKKGYYRWNFDCYCEIDNCEQCGENTCLKCSTGYYYNSENNKCEELIDVNKTMCFDENCDICFSEENGSCLKCKDGYFERKGECNKLLVLDENNTSCPEDYYQSGNFCLEKCDGVQCKNPYNLLFYPGYYTCSSNKCLICVNNELKIFSECDNSEECSSMEGCLNCITNEECIFCNQGYYLLGGICYKCIEGCSKCTNRETCDFCISGYELDSNKTCILTNNFDYNVDIYKNFKSQLIHFYYPEEIIDTTPTEKVTDEITSKLSQTDEITSKLSQTDEIDSETPYTIEVPLILDCDQNCAKCYDNTGICLECEQLFSLENNRCIKHCSDEKCLDCYLKNEKEYCSQCQSGYTPSGDKCSLICSDNNCLKCSLSNNIQYCQTCKSNFRLQNGKCLVQCEDNYCENCSDDGKTCYECEERKKLFDGKCASEKSICSQFFQYCNYCFSSEQCLECASGYKFDKSGKNCEKKSDFITVIFTIIIIGIILVGIASYCIYRKRKSNLRNEIRRMRIHENQNSVNIYRRNGDQLDVSGSSRNSFTKEELADEFELQRKKKEKGNQTCQYCKKKPGKYKCDCGCIVCKEHSSLKNVEGDGEKYKVCFACEKIVKKVILIKYPCHICFSNKLSVAHFKCGCALEVCKTCYIKCKMGNNKCPGCRAII